MAILEIISHSNEPMEHSFARGNTGSVLDLVSKMFNEFLLPALGAVCNYPDETDVRDGVAYGDADSLVGNVVLPLESQVETGVQFGANGNEFEGNFAGGGNTIFTYID